MVLGKMSDLLHQRLGQRMHWRLAQTLAVEILAGRLPVGHAFPGEIEMSENLDISRTALREAFRVLSAKGLVESRPKAGSRVTAKERWSVLDPDILAWRFQAEPSLDFVRDLFELRMIIEPAVAELAAARRTNEHLDEMRGALEEMVRYGLATDEGRMADQRFHVGLLKATANEMVMGLASSVMAAIAWTTLLKVQKNSIPRDPIDEHLALFDAIADRDKLGARERMAELVRLALADTELALQSDNPA